MYKNVSEKIERDEIPSNVHDVISMGQNILNKIFTQREIMEEIQTMIDKK